MDRIFHARTAWYQFLLLFVLGINTFFLMWCKFILPALLLALLLLVVIEQIIHTTYTITADGRLILFYGRFRRQRIIPIDSIQSVQKEELFRLGRRAVASYLLLEYGDHRFVSIMPVDEDAFLKVLASRKS